MFDRSLEGGEAISVWQVMAHVCVRMCVGMSGVSACVCVYVAICVYEGLDIMWVDIYIRREKS